MITAQEQTSIELLNTIIEQALARKASDIHIEPTPHQGRIRIRCDGLLALLTECSNDIFQLLVSRIKIMAHLNIAERRLPQDGYIHSDVFDQVAIRVSTSPTLFGEKIVLRLLPQKHSILELDNLGLEPQQLSLVLQYLSMPQGLILVTGPTGCGKTSTLYAALQQLNQIEKNILSIEDPVEIHLPGVNQVNINLTAGLDFAKALRAFLRQDPDIILIGEIRDRETAYAAIHAAQTGHLVLSSLHANTALGTLMRLHTLGIELSQIMTVITLIINQRLVRTLCHDCEGESTNRCQNCNDGYLGRIGIFEIINCANIITITSDLDHLRQLILEQQKDFLSLEAAAQLKIQHRITNFAELTRVLSCHSHR